MGFSLPSIKSSAGPPSLRLLPNSVSCLNSARRFDHRTLGSSRKLGGAGEHLIEDSEKRICRLSFEFQSPHVIERRSNQVLNFFSRNKAEFLNDLVFNVQKQYSWRLRVLLHTDCVIYIYFFLKKVLNSIYIYFLKIRTCFRILA